MAPDEATTTFNFDYPGRQDSNAAAQEAVLRERIDLGEHVHLLGRPATKCWNGNERCMVWLAQGSHDDCVFCDIVAGSAPATVVREWADALCIAPLNPVVAGHVLVLPRVHVETFFSNPEVSAATMRRAAELLHGVERHHEPRDHNVITSAGPAATQTVMHLHVHIVPRSENDGLALPWTGQEATHGA